MSRVEKAWATVTLFLFLTACPSNTSNTVASRTSYPVGIYRIEVRSWSSPRSAQMAVFQDNNLVFGPEGKSSRYRVLAMNGRQNVDVTGNGRPNLVVQGQTGTSCAMDPTYVFETGPEFRLLYKFEAADLTMQDLDGDGRAEFVFDDTAVGELHMHPQVIGRLSETELVFAPDLMLTKSKPKVRELERRAVELRVLAMQSPDFSTQTGYGSWRASVISEMNRLVYLGRIDLARSFLQLAWPPGPVSRRAEFWTDFLDKLKGSAYWSDLVELNSNSGVRTSSRGLRPLLQ